MTTAPPSVEAWNNFVMRTSPGAYEKGTAKRAAAIATLFQGLVNNGGINSFLTSADELDGAEVLEALVFVGALKAAQELRRVLAMLKGPIKASSSQQERWALLERVWSDEIDDQGLDTLSEDADRDLTRALEQHVRENEDFYLSLR